MLKSNTVAGLVRRAARARWGSQVVCLNSATLPQAARVTGSLMVVGDALVLLGAPNLATVYAHNTVRMGCAKLRMSAQLWQLNDLVVTIYTVRGEHTAYMRSGSPELALGGEVASRSPLRLGRHETRSHAARTHGRIVAAAVATALVLAACASTKLVTPDGRERVPVNTPESLLRYQDLVAREEALALEKSRLERQVEALTQEVDALKQYVQAHSIATQLPLGSSSAHHPKRTMQSPAAAAASAADSAPLETISVGDTSVTFRLSEGADQTDFKPSGGFETKLLKAVGEAKEVLIRSRTDADATDSANAQIALGRALGARAYLIRHGVSSSKIRTWYRSAGDFVADNRTEAGKALNRRVEIEARGMDTASYASKAANTMTAGK
jgi:outer membrane protein OmpA-like peptidoglycan-associated protein